MTPLETLVLATYFFILIVLAGYGWHRYYLVYVYMKHKDKVPVPAGLFERLPMVTVQLPIYNEMYVVDRLIDAVARMDYPRDRFEVQVLDDSTDETRSIAELAVRRAAAQGLDISYLHRTDRTGFKAGALEAGMLVAKGEFLAIFDADFLPTPEFLHRTVHHFVDPKVAVVQARWGHINAGYSLLTKIQSILLDAHFVLEHGGRNRAGHFLQLQRHGRHLAPRGHHRRRRLATRHADGRPRPELSHAARGWKFHFVPDVVVPAELPVEMNAFKSQQHRWAKGSIQTCRKLLPRILASNQPLGVKAEAFFHLSANFNYVLMVALSVLMFPAMVIRYNMGWYEMLLIDVPLFFAATASVANFYIVCQRELYPKEWIARLKYLPFLMSIGIGLAINNARAVFEAMMGNQTEFIRTPKYHIEDSQDEWVGKKYRQANIIQPIIELSLGLYFTFTVFYALSNRIYGTLPFLMLFQIGFLYTGLLSIVQQFADDSVALDTQTEG